MTRAAPAVFTNTAHGLTAGTAIAFETTGALYTGLSPLSAGAQYYVAAAGLTANTFDVTAASTGTNFTIGGTAFTTTIANPAVFTSAIHGLVVGNQVSFATTGALPTGLTAGTAYYVKQVPTVTVPSPYRRRAPTLPFPVSPRRARGSSQRPPFMALR